MEPSTLERIVLVAPVFVFSIIAHEVAHGYAALRQGDSTALALGRLSFNPVKHIDPFMSILMPIVLWFGSHGTFTMGGAKPVPVNPRNYRNFKRGDIIVSLAGVSTNFAIALVCTALIPLFGIVARYVPLLESSLGLLQGMMTWGVLLNFGLLAFNLLPIPPLDGSHVMKYLLPPAWALKYQQVGRYGFLILVLILGFGSSLLEVWLRPAYFAVALLVTSVGGFFLPGAIPWLPFPAAS
ncbi:MAG: site-2 protease family protein [Gemmatimonadaceae bacterium]